MANTSPGRAGSLEAYIVADELAMGGPGKSRAASMDNIGAKRRLMSASRGSNRAAAKQPDASALPQIGNIASTATTVRSGVAQPTIVLPHSEPLSEEQKTQYVNLIELFGT